MYVRVDVCVYLGIHKYARVCMIEYVIHICVYVFVHICVFRSARTYVYSYVYKNGYIRMYI